MVIGSAQPTKRIVRAIDEIPAISPIVGKLRQISRDLEASPRDLVKLVMLDPVLTGKVIRLVNSSFYGLPNKITSLAQAVVLLGMNTVKNLAMSTAILRTLRFSQKNAPMGPDDFWRHCLATAVGCRYVAKLRGVPAQQLEEFFVAGLLHDLGKIVFIKAVPDEYRRALEEAERMGVALWFAELAHFGCTHTQIGGMLGRSWKLHRSLIRVIEDHHQSDLNELPDDVTRIVITANNLCKRMKIGAGGNPIVEEVSEDLCRMLGVNAEHLLQLEERLPREMKKAEIFLNVAKED